MASSVEIEISNQIRFFGQIVGTAGMDEEINKIANGYLKRLVVALAPFVGDYVEEAEDLVKQRKEDQERAGNVILEPTEGDFANLKIMKD